MSETKDKKWMIPDISRKYPTYRDVGLKTVQSWFAGKRIDDNAEGLWRIHDAIYDFSDFIKQHPGGQSWLEETKGTDITEAFEAHHISLKPQNMLQKFKVRDAAEPRNITLTLKDDGFYKTLKNRVREKLKEIDYKPAKTSDLINTGLIIATYSIAVLSAVFKSNALILLGGLILCWTVITAHNYFHRKDNWRMYTFNLSFMNYHDWRVSHALSHHLYPNSYHDLELSMFEPFFCWVPNPHIKNWIQRYGSWIYGPIIYIATFLIQFITRLIYSFKTEFIMYPSDLVVFTLPMVMYIFSGQDLTTVIKTWLAIEFAASYTFGLIGLNAAHHHPEIYHPGDAILKDRDWGLYQLDTIADRPELKGSQFLVLTHFGDHALHHLFPTLDHGILPQLYPVLFQTMKEFEGQLKHLNWFQHFIGQHKQLARITPNPVARGRKAN